MAKHRRRNRYHRRHRNPFGIDRASLTDAAWVALGAVGASTIPGMVSPKSARGWSGVGFSAATAVALSVAAKAIGGPSSAEVLKGGLAVAVIKALHEMGIAKNLGLGLYAPAWFPIPTSSSQYMQTAYPGNQFNRGYGTIYFPGPGAAPALPAAPAMGYHRFRSRYQGGYGAA